MMASVTGLTPAQYRCKFDSCANDDGTYFPGTQPGKKSIFAIRN